MKSRVFVGIILIATLVGCGNGSSTSLNGAEFSSLRHCLSSLGKELGEKLNIVIDESDEVTGKQRDGTFWACNKKITGTKGVYWEGYYSVKTK